MTTTRVPILACAAVALCLLIGTGCGETEFEYSQQLNYTTTLQLSPTEITADDRTVLLAKGTDFTLTTMTPELVQYKDKFKELRIEQLTYEVTDNTLDADIDAIEVSFGPLETNDPSDASAVLIATVDAIPAGSNAAGDAEIHHENTRSAAPHVFGLDFAVIQGTEFQVPAGTQAPSGSMKMSVELFITLIADPL